MCIGGNVVMKQFMDVDGAQRVLKLVKIHQLLLVKNVPHVSKLDNYDLNNNYRRVFLSPVGRHVLPSSGEEAYNAVVCVLQALQVRYDVSVFII